MNDCVCVQTAGHDRRNPFSNAHSVERLGTACNQPVLGKPLCFFHLPLAVRRRIYELVLQEYGQIERCTKFGTASVHQCTLFQCPVLVRNDQRTLFAAIRLPFRQSRKWRSRHVEGIISPPIYSFFRHPLPGSPPAEFPRIDYRGLDHSMNVLIDVTLRTAQPPCVTITPYLLPEDDMPFFIEARRQLQSAGWPAYFNDAMERLSGLISTAIALRGGHGITIDEFQLIVDFGKDLAHVMVSFLTLGERLTNQAERRKGQRTAQPRDRHLASAVSKKESRCTNSSPCKQQTIPFFHLPAEIRARIYAHLPTKRSLTEPQHDSHLLTSLHKFQPQPLLHLPEILRLEGPHAFDHLRMCIYLFSIDGRRRWSRDDQSIPTWSFEELFSKGTAAWLRDSRPGWMVEFNHLRVCGPEGIRFDIGVVDDGKGVRIKDARGLMDTPDVTGGALERYSHQQELANLRTLARRLEGSIRDRQGAGISVVEIRVLVDEMLKVMQSRRRRSKEGERDIIAG